MSTTTTTPRLQLDIELLNRAIVEGRIELRNAVEYSAACTLVEAGLGEVELTRFFTPHRRILERIVEKKAKGGA